MGFSYPILSDNARCQLVPLASDANFLPDFSTLKLTLFQFIIIKHFVGSYFETMKIACSLSSFQLLVLVMFLGQCNYFYNGFQMVIF